VITESVVNGERRIVTVGGQSSTGHPRSYKPNARLLDRFALHFSIGQAY
jgi:hypothetical protein